jgi:hypothetical protein
MILEEVFNKVLVIILATVVGLLATYPTISAMLQIFATCMLLQQQAGKASVH